MVDGHPADIDQRLPWAYLFLKAGLRTTRTRTGVAMSKTRAGQSEVSGGGFHRRPEADGDNP
jgi:hypothetical protein